VENNGTRETAVANPLEEEIKRLEEEKRGLIEKIRKVTKQRKYVEIELKALLPLAEQAEKEKVGDIVRRIKMLEFEVSTKALTPKAEKKYIKKIMELERKLAEKRPLLRAKKRVKFLSEDLERLKAEEEEIDKQIKAVKEKLRELYRKRRFAEEAKKKNIMIAEKVEEAEAGVTLADLMDNEGNI